MSGRQSLGKLVGQIALTTAEHEIEADVRAWTERKLLAAEGIAEDRAKEEGGFIFHALAEQKKTAATAAGAAQRATVENTGFFARVAGLLGIHLGAHVATEAGKTAATTTGAATRAGAETTEIAAVTAAQKAAALVQVPTLAALAGAGGVASMAAAPFPIDLTAPAFGAAMSATALGYGAIAGFERGVDVVPNDMIAQIHAGERVIPRADNTRLIEAMDAMAGRGFGGRSDGGGGQTHHYGPVHIHAIDSASVERWMRRNGQSLQKIIGERVRQNGAVAMGFAR